MMKGKKIAFYIARYSHSGVPLAQIRLAKAFLRRGYKIEFLIGYTSPNLKIPVIPGAKVINLNISRTSLLIYPIAKHIKKYKPDIIFSAEDHLNTIVSMAAFFVRSEAKISASSRISPYRTYSDKLLSKEWVLKYLNPIARRRIDVNVCVSKDMIKAYQEIFGETNHQAIYNIAYDQDTSIKMSEIIEDAWIADNSIPLVITAGRLSPGKGFPDLINAIDILKCEMPIKLAILGEGESRKELESLIKSKNLEDTVRLLGFQSNPLKYFNKANVFVLSSYFEGLPNVLIEAMASGCSVVSTDCPTGPREVLQDGKFGDLIPMHNPEAMAKAIKKSLINPTSEELLNEAIAPFREMYVIEQHLKSLRL